MHEAEVITYPFASISGLLFNLLGISPYEILLLMSHFIGLGNQLQENKTISH